MAETKTHEFVATGRRKTAVARVRLAVGSGKIVVNGRPVENYFPTEVLRGMVTQPFHTTQTLTRFDARINVAGGGPTGQAGAVRHGIARAPRGGPASAPDAQGRRLSDAGSPHEGTQEIRPAGRPQAFPVLETLNP